MKGFENHDIIKFKILKVEFKLECTKLLFVSC